MMERMFILLASLCMTAAANPLNNGPTPGCAGPICHPYQTGIMTVTTQSNGNVIVSLSGFSGPVAGELVRSATNLVVDFENSTTSNPFTLQAQQGGSFYVNAGYLGPYETKTIWVNIVPVEPISMGIIRSLFK